MAEPIVETRIAWPGGARCAIMLSFDLDAETIVARGHETDHHSYLHEWNDPEIPEAEKAELDNGLEALKRTVGVVPAGHCSPAGETSDNMVRLLTGRGFTCDSSMMDLNNPCRHPKNLIELPWHWSLDDAISSLFSIRNPRPILANSRISEVWQEEFREIHAWGSLFGIVMHPPVTGRQIADARFAQEGKSP